MTHRSRIPFILLFLLPMLLVAAEAKADRRIFGYVYPALTLPQGGLELEHYADLGLAGWDDPATPGVEHAWSRPAWRHQIELEYGITDHLDFGFYNVFSQDPFGALRFDGVKLRSRYRLGEVGDHWMDTALYGELEYYGDEVAAEEMIILGKRVGRLEIAFNLVGEQEYSAATKEMEYAFKPALGVGFHVTPWLALSLEYHGELAFEDEEVEFVSYLGPSLSVAGRNFFWTLAVLPQIGNEAGLARIQLRSLFGITL